MSVAETLLLDDVISIVVLADMELRLSTQYVAREGDHNSATFRIVRQPLALDSLVCRAEIETAQGKNYYLVDDNGEFALTQDIAIAGPGRMQLVYSDGVEIMRKTSIAHFTVMPSINAVDPSDPDFQDGLAQLQTEAFANAIGDDRGIQFYNIANQPLHFVPWPPGSGEGLDEATADTLYLRLNGLGVMQGSVGIAGANRGMIWEDSGRQGALYSTGTQLVLRLPEGDPPLLQEPNSGNAVARTPYLTQMSGDARYLTPAQAETTYARLAGAQFTGPLITQPGTSLTNLGISIGDNATGFWRATGFLILSVGGALAVQWSPTEMFMGQPINMAVQRITNVGNPTAPGDAVPRSYVDNAVAAARPNARTYLTNTVDLINTSAQILLDQLYPVPNNNPRTVTVTIFPTFEGGTPSAFYDLIYTCSIAPLIEARSTCYPTAGAYMYAPVRFAATVTPNNNAIQVQVAVRLNAQATSALTIVGSSENKRSYVTIEEQQN